MRKLPKIYYLKEVFFTATTNIFFKDLINLNSISKLFHQQNLTSHKFFNIKCKMFYRKCFLKTILTIFSLFYKCKLFTLSHSRYWTKRSWCVCTRAIGNFSKINSQCIHRIEHNFGFINCCLQGRSLHFV